MTDDDDFKVDVPADLTVTQAVLHLLDQAVARDVSAMEGNIAGIDFVAGFIDVEAYDAEPSAYTNARLQDWFLQDVSQLLGVAKPQSSELPLMKNYPLSSQSLTALFTTPHAELSMEKTHQLVCQIGHDYCNHLFTVLEKTAAAGDTKLMQDCLNSIYHNVIDHIPNSKEHLTAERRNLLIKSAATVGCLTSSLKHSFQTAGIGPSSWDMVAHDAILQQASSDGKLVMPASSKLH